MTEIEYIINELQALYEEVEAAETYLAIAVLELIEEDSNLNDLVYFCQNGVYPE
jgi:hypothetical protein